jgi:hypothetical protein
VCVKRLGNPALSEIFPGFSVNLRGLVR